MELTLEERIAEILRLAGDDIAVICNANINVNGLLLQPIKTAKGLCIQNSELYKYKSIHYYKEEISKIQLECLHLDNVHMIEVHQFSDIVGYINLDECIKLDCDFCKNNNRVNLDN